MKNAILLLGALALGITSVNAQEVGARFGEISGGNIPGDADILMGYIRQVAKIIAGK